MAKINGGMRFPRAKSDEKRFKDNFSSIDWSSKNEMAPEDLVSSSLDEATELLLSWEKIEESVEGLNFTYKESYEKLKERLGFK